MKNFNLLRKSERKSVGTTLALTVGSPSAHRRYSALKHLAFMLLFLLGSLNVWGEDVTVSLTSWTQSISAYNSTVWTDNGCSFTYASNNQTKWAYVRCGGKNTSATSTIKYNSKVTVPVDYVVLNTSNGINGSSGYNVTITGISVSAYSNAACTSLVSSADLGTLAYTNSNCPTSITITPTTAWVKDLYYVISISWTETGNKNGGLNVSGITFHESTGGGDVIVKTLKSIAVEGMTTSYEVGDAFSFDGTCTATYSVTKNDEPQPDENKVVTPTEVTSPDMSSVGNKTITVSYTEDAVTKTTTYDITVSAALPKFIIDGNPLTSTATTEETTKTYTGTDGSSTVDIVFSDGAKKQAVGSGAVNNLSSNPTILIGKTGKNIHNSTPFPGEITKFELYYNKGAANGTSVSVTFSATPLSEAATSGDNLYTVTFADDTYKDKVYDCTSKVPEGALYFWYQVTSNSNSQVQFRVTYEEPEPAAVEVPTISGETPFLTSTTVTLACATDGATIYYTTDGSDPKTSGTKQTGTSFTLNNTATVRAIANKGDDWSEEATSKTFTKIEPEYTTIAAFLTGQPSSDKYIQFAGNVVVTGVNGKNVYVQDESGNAICIYFATAPSPAWTKGHKVTGMFQAKYATYGNMPEMSIAAGNEGSIAATETADIPDPTEITSLAEATINANMCKYVVLKGVYFQSQSLTSKAVDLQDASSNELKFYDNLSLTSGKVLPLTATACDVTGVLISYHQNSPSANINEILPVDVACINAGAATLPTLSTSGSTDEEHPTMVANGENIAITPEAGFNCTLNGNPLNAATNISITETESNTVIAVSASRDYYATANATYYFKANPAGTKYAITVVQPAQGGSLEANFAETEAGNTVALTATPTNSHFTFDGWVVKKTGEPEATPETVSENQFTMPEYDVTITGSFTEEAKATLTFAKGEATGTEDAPENIVDYADEVITLPTCPFTYTGHYFIGWKKGETEEIYQPGAYTITAADVTADAIAFTAQWEVGNVFEWVAAGHGYENNDELGLVNSEPIAIEFAQGEANNAPKYFTSDNTARFYNGGTLTITAPENYLISKIEFTTGEWGVKENKGTLDGKTWTGLAQEVIFTANATSKVKSIKIYYKEGVAATLEIDDIEMEYTDVVTITPKTVTPPAAASHVSYDIKAGSDDCITLADDQITAKSVTGTATIVATIPDAEGGEYLGTSVEFTVSVSASDSRKKAKSPNAGFATISGNLNADIAYAAYQGDGTSTPNIKDAAIQLYQRGSGKASGSFVTFTAVKGCKIDQVKITTASKTTHIAYSVDDEALSATTENVTAGSDYLTDASLDATSVSIYCMHTSSDNRLFVANATVYYTGEPAALHHLKLSGEYPTEFEQGAAFSHEGLVVTACYDEGETDKEVVTNQADISTPNMNVAGEQTITVSFGGKTAEYTITINAAAGTDDLTGTWNLVTDAAALKAGMKVIIAQHVESDGAIYTMGDQKTNNRDAVASTVAGTTLAPNFRTRVFVLEDAGNGMFALQTSNGKYLSAAGSGTNNYLKEAANYNSDKEKWTITIADNKAKIQAASTNRNTIRYNSTSSLFSCYAEDGQAAIALYARPFDYERGGLQQGMLGTICLPNGGKIAGASIFEIAYMDYETNGITPYKIYFDEVEGGIMEAGMPYAILANEGSSHLGVYYTDSENKTAQSKKGLVGYMDESGRALAENEYFIYNNMFYYVSAADAASGRIHISKNHAFINLSAVPGYNNEPISVPAPGRRVSIGNGAPAVATGLENGELKSDEMKKVLINGELFIIRGEKMYDATGRLVK